MEKVKKEVKVFKTVESYEERDVFRAWDGLEFSREDDCIKYERKLEFDKEFSKIKRIPTHGIIPTANDSIGFKNWYRLESKEDYDLLKKYITKKGAYKDNLISDENYLLYTDHYYKETMSEIEEFGFVLVTIGVFSIDMVGSYDPPEVECSLEIVPLTVLSKSMSEMYDLLIQELPPEEN